MTKIEKELNNSVLAELLGAKGIEELRSKLIDIICEEVRDQLQNSANYITTTVLNATYTFRGIDEVRKTNTAIIAVLS